MQIHSRKMTTSKDVNFDELARSTDDFNGAQCKAVCVEAGKNESELFFMHFPYQIEWDLNCVVESKQFTSFLKITGMIALRREATIVTHEDFMDAILEVQAKKKQNLNYYAWLFG